MLKGDFMESWDRDEHTLAVLKVLRDMMAFSFHLASLLPYWNNLEKDQQYNVQRASSELHVLTLLMCLGMWLGEPEEHKKEFWRRFFIYQVKRIKMETRASMPTPWGVDNFLSILQSPIAAVRTLNSVLYATYGYLYDWEPLKSGPNKGENKYWRNVKKYVLPFYKDIQALQNLDVNDGVFKIFDPRPNK